MNQLPTIIFSKADAILVSVIYVNWIGIKARFQQHLGSFYFCAEDLIQVASCSARFGIAR